MSDLLKALFVEEEFVAPSDLTEQVFSEPVIQIEQTSHFKKRLIYCVRKQPQLYDTTNEEFSNQELKNTIWNTIAKKLGIEAEICQQVWADLRYEYQLYVRRLRKFLLNSQQNRKRRPVFAFESEMLFLWRFIRSTTRAPLPYKKAPHKAAIVPEPEEDDVVILDEEPVVIVLDDEDKNEPKAPKFKITQEMRKLIELVKSYPELYDSEHQYFNDYRRKGIIWNAIANEGHDKATRLMKLWIQLQTRFEWEIWHNKSPEEECDNNDLRVVLKFMREAILKNPKTVYKQSLFLKLSWYDPIDHFKNIFNLIALLKRHLDVVNETEKKITPNKDTEYVAAWTKMAQVRTPTLQSQPGQLEATWLILRHFYWELMGMRQSSYQLQDKWYFESIITEMYAQAKKLAEPEPVPVSASVPVQAPVSKSTPTAQPVMRTATPPVTTPTSLSTTVQATQIFNAPTNLQSQMVMPKIVSAKSLAVPQINPTQTLNTPKGLQIYQVMPQNAMTVIPQSQQISTFPAATSIQNQQPQQVLMTQQPNMQSNMMTLPRIASVHTMATMANLTRPSNSATITMAHPSSPRVTYSITTYTPSLATTVATSNTPPFNVKIPATIMPVRQPMQNTQPVPVKLVAAPNAPIPSRPVAKPSTTTLPTMTPMPLQPTIQQINQIPMPTLTPIPGARSNVTFGGTPTINTNINTQNIQLNPVNKENNATHNVNNLGRNEILIELNQTVDGNRLIVHGPPLSVPFSMNMNEVTAFIREILAFPVLHNKNTTQTSRVQAYWVFIATKFNMPSHICRAIWNFLSENFHNFPKIAPMEVLMAPPFYSEAHAWQPGTDLFKKFYENFVKKGWTMYMDKLPTLIQKIGQERSLYQDLLRNQDAAAPANVFKLQGTWNSLRVVFGIHCVDEIWTAFKSAFWQYMQEIECGYENHWPQPLWRTLAKMDFLIHQRYHMREPFYYIVRNKFHEEIAHCQNLENSNIAQQPQIQVLPTPVVVQNIAAQNALIPTITSYEIDAYNLLAAVRRHSEIYLSNDQTQKDNAWAQVAQELKTNVIACRLTFQRALKNYRNSMMRDPPKRCRMNQRYYKNMHAIYRAVTTTQKINIKTPNELNQSVGDASDPNDVVFPERMIMDINMDNCDAGLTMKNWMYGIGNCSQFVQNNVPDKLQAIFSKYEKFAVL